MGSNIVARISGRAHRFSDILFGLGSDPIIGLGNIAYPVNQNWLPSIVLSQDQSGAVDGPLAFVIAATELFAATVLCGRLNGFAIGPSIAAGWLITMTTWQLFGLADDRHHMVLLSRPCRGARCFDCHGEHDISSRQVALGPARGRHHFSSDTRGSDVVRYDSADFLGSAGRSILLLPVEFSRCLKISDAAGGAPRLFRADLMLTGVLF